MKPTLPTRASLLALAALLCTALTAAPAAAQDSAALAALLARVSPSIVTVRIVTTTTYKSGGQEQNSESRMELQGVVVTPQGLVMLSYLPFNSVRMKQLMGAFGGGGDSSFGITIKPTKFKVVFENDLNEYEAYLAATDQKLDLAFIQVEGLNGKALTPVQFTGGGTPAIGDRVYSIGRLTKGYDYAPFFQNARVCGQINKPRPAWLVDGSVTEMGLPVYNSAGSVVGVLTDINAASGADSGDSGADFMSMARMFGGGAGMQSFLVPSSGVNGVIALATTQAADLAAKRAAAAKATPAAPAKPKPF
ncbi:MAG: trypsin-like peptidase domain-containing protein [Armatimonadetes bacterium]|nr:trypsin-like peptidase domain-containing protein [Armatimonadota bacterium]MDE2206229.1 trypsin-like peptidase domain-containing protein [Armatimonadota bacterium]